MWPRRWTLCIESSESRGAVSIGRVEPRGLAPVVIKRLIGQPGAARRAGRRTAAQNLLNHGDGASRVGGGSQGSTKARQAWQAWFTIVCGALPPNQVLFFGSFRRFSQNSFCSCNNRPAGRKRGRGGNETYALTTLPKDASDSRPVFPLSVPFAVRSSTMKTTFTNLIAIATIAAFGLSASTASADNHKKKHKSQPDDQSSQFYLNDLDNAGDLVNLISHLKHKHKDDSKPDDRVPIDPGKGNGQTTTPPSMPGFVWVGDHWERERAPKKVTQTPQGMSGFVWVGDHWERDARDKKVTQIVDPYPGVLGSSDTSSPTITVRDHTNGTTQLITPNGTITIRDHGGSASGGVQVTSDPIVRDHRNSADPIVRDHRNGADQGGGGGLLGTASGMMSGLGHAVSGIGGLLGGTAKSAGNVAGDVLGLGGGSSSADQANVTVIRDHRTTGSANVTVVRDHRN